MADIEIDPPDFGSYCVEALSETFGGDEMLASPAVGRKAMQSITVNIISAALRTLTEVI